jgi:TolA-binding protein
MSMRLLFFAFLMVSSLLLAQKTTIYHHDLKDFNRALELYQQQQYESAQRLFRQVKDENLSPEVHGDCAYFMANCAIRLDQSNGTTLMERYMADFPTHHKHNLAYLEIGDYYFESRKFPLALDYYSKVNEGSLSVMQNNQLNFNKGYCHFTANKRKDAINFFKKVQNDSQYASQAKYYIGYIEYEGDNFKEASKYFDQVQDNDKYKEKMSYYQADMNFKLGNFQKAIDVGQPALPKSDVNEKSELNKIIGESHFNLKQYAEAIPYLNLYKGKKGKFSNTDFYLIGYSYYKTNDFENAIGQFNKIIDGQDHVAQNAYYHLGESYLKTNKKQQALNAFKNASEMDQDRKIQEDAFLNYAKLSYELGNPYKAVPDVIQDFLKKYPQSAFKTEMETLLIDSYISSKNYKQALTLLEKDKSSLERKKAYQIVTFFRGLEFYYADDYNQALKMFRTSLTENHQPRIAARAYFWQGDMLYQLNDFQAAINSFIQFENHPEAKNTSEFSNYNYHLGYAHFKKKDYETASSFFQKQILANTKDKERLSDSYLRSADALFISAKYWPAMEAYNKVIDMKINQLDYASYQKALSYGFVNRKENKITDLNAFIKNFPNSSYRDDALYELGATYANDNKNELAIKTFDQLHKDYPKGAFTAKAILRQGLIHFNSNQSELAITKFKRVATDFPGSPESLEAVNVAKQIYIDMGRVNDYADWVKTLTFIDVSDAELDNTTYEAAEKQYLQNNSKAAISGFMGYLAKYAQGIHSLKAHFYLAQLQYAEENYKASIANYKVVADRPLNEFSEQALARLCELYIKEKQTNEAFVYLKRLEAEAQFQQNVLYAQSNLMRLSYESNDYAQTVIYAEKVLSQAKMDARIKNDAQIMIARSAMKTNQESKAKDYYALVMKNAQGELAAEALFYDAYFKFKEGKHEASNASIQKLSKDFSGFKYWGAKGLVVMAKNFYALKDSYQATFILEAVIKNFDTFKDVVDEAKTALDGIKAEESKRNSSIQND